MKTCCLGGEENKQLHPPKEATGVLGWEWLWWHNLKTHARAHAPLKYVFLLPACCRTS